MDKDQNDGPSILPLEVREEYRRKLLSVWEHTQAVRAAAVKLSTRLIDNAESENDLELKLSLKDVQKQDDIAESETKTEGYDMLDLRINKTYSLNNDSDFSFSLFAKNLLDEAARNHSSFVKDEVPLPGRNYGIKFNYKF